MESLNSGNGISALVPGVGGQSPWWTKPMVENTHINIEQACGDYRNWKYMAFCWRLGVGVNKYYDIDIKSS